MTPAPAHPAYVNTFNRLQSVGFSLSDKDILDKVHLFNNPPSPEGILETLVETRVIPTSADNGTGEVTLTLLRPKGSENEILPVAIYLHGGGWVLGSYKISEKLLKDLVVKAHIAVIYVEYTLSPKVKFPVALEEIYSSVLWVYDNATSINVNPSKLSVFGDSAGGNLSAAISILLKRRGHGNVVKNQVLLYPVVAFSRDGYESVKDYGHGDYVLTNEDMDVFISFYHNGTHKAKNDQRVTGPEDALYSPLLATNDELKDLPRSLILTAECDLLRDEGEDYARRLVEAGVDTFATRFIGAMHGFATMAYDAPHYQNAVALIARYLN